MKLNKEQKKQAQELCDKHSYKRVFINNKGEFFTEHGLALMSVGNDKQLVAEYSPFDFVTKSAQDGNGGDPLADKKAELEKVRQTIAVKRDIETDELSEDEYKVHEAELMELLAREEELTNELEGEE